MQRAPTPAQKLMIALIAGAFLFLLAFLIPEFVGVFDPAPEDTLSEWVFDLPLPAVLGIAGLFVLTGVVFVWAGGHFVEGWNRRRDKGDDNEDA